MTCSLLPLAAQAAVAADPDAGMWALLKIAAVFAVMVLLVRKRVEIGYVLLIAAVLLGVLLGVGYSSAAGERGGLGWLLSGTWKLAVQMVRAAVLPKSIRLLLLVLGVTVFGAVMKRVEKLKALTSSLLALLRDRRWAMGAVASLIGLLPMPGGAMLSAPMVGEVAEDVDLTREEKAAINHWMRHVWEFIDPLYPGLLTAASVLSVPIAGLMLAQSPFTLVAIVSGVVLLLHRVPHHQRGVGPEHGERLFGPVMKAVAPVLVIVAAAAVPLLLGFAIQLWPALAGSLPGGSVWLDKRTTELSMLAGVVAVIAFLLATNRVGWRESVQVVRGGVTLKITALVVGVCVLQGMLESSGATPGIKAFLESTGVPVPILIGFIVFLVGMLTGYTMGFVGICYPMLKPLLMLPDGGANYPLAAFTYCLGFLGVLLSPVHLCLVLTREHFDARWGGVYRHLAIPTLVVFGAACLMLLWA